MSHDFTIQKQGSRWPQQLTTISLIMLVEYEKN
jgi:hypothetical protein